MKYLIYSCEFIAILLVVLFTSVNIWLKVIATIVIIALSQLAHTLLKAR